MRRAWGYFVGSKSDQISEGSSSGDDNETEENENIVSEDFHHEKDRSSIVNHEQFPAEEEVKEGQILDDEKDSQKDQSVDKEKEAKDLSVSENSVNTSDEDGIIVTKDDFEKRSEPATKEKDSIIEQEDRLAPISGDVENLLKTTELSIDNQNETQNLNGHETVSSNTLDTNVDGIVETCNDKDQGTDIDNDNGNSATSHRDQEEKLIVAVEDLNVLSSHSHVDEKVDNANAIVDVKVESTTTNDEEDKSDISNYFSDDDDEIDEDDPFGFEADREQEALLEAFRSGYVDIEPLQHTKYKDSKPVKIKPVSNTEIIHTRDKEDEVHPNQALFDILNRNFDDLDSFHIPSLNRMITSEEVKVFFVAFVLVLTPPKPLMMAQEYNHDLDSELMKNHLNSASHETTNGISKRRRGWLFSRKKQDKNTFDSMEIVSKDEEQEDVAEESNKKPYIFVRIPCDVVYALWAEVLRGLGIIEKIHEETESARLIIKYVQESLIELGLLEIEKSRASVISTDRQDRFMHVHDSSSASISSDTSKESEFCVVRHEINEQYGLYLANSSQSSMIKNQVKHNEKSWFMAATSVHCTNSDNTDDYQVKMLPYLLALGGKVIEAKDLLCKESFIVNRFERLGVLESVTVELTDVDLLVKSLEANNALNFFDVNDFITSIGSQFKVLIDDRLAELQSKDLDDDHENSAARKSERKTFIEAGKALHLIALILGSLGNVTKELEYHAMAINLKQSQLGPNENSFGAISLADSYHCMGLAYDNIGDFEEAMVCYDRALLSRRTYMGNSDLKVAETCHSMGSLLCENGEFDNAYMLLNEALSIKKYNLSDMDESIADTEQWLGNVMRETGRLEEALDFFNSALKCKKAKLGNDHEDVADAMHNMAVVLDDLEKYELSVGCYQEALRIREVVYGHDGLMVADTLLCLGNTYKSLNRENKAMSHFKESIEIRERLVAPLILKLIDNSFIETLQDLPDDIKEQYNSLIECYTELLSLLRHVETNAVNEIEYLEKIGDAYSVIRNWDDAYESYESALKLKDNNCSELQYKIGITCIRKEEFSISHSHLNAAMRIKKQEHGDETTLIFKHLYALGVSYNHLEQHQEAISSFTECLRLLKKDSQNKITEGHSQFWIGKSYYESGDFSKATASILSSLKLYNANRPNVKEQVIIKALHLLGNAYFRQKQLKLALKCYEEEIALYNKVLNDYAHGENFLTEAYFCAGNIHAKRRSYDDASECFEKALEARERFEGEENDKVARILHKLGTIYLKKNEYIKAKEKLTDAHCLLHRLNGANDAYTAAVEFKLGQIFDHLKDYVSAMHYYKECLNARQSLHGLENEEVAITLFYLGKNACLRFKTDESIEYFEKALDIRRKIFTANHDLVAAVLYELGRSYYQRKSADKALLCYREALRIWKLVADEVKASQVAFTIAEFFEEDNKFHLAIKSYLECNILDPSDNSKLCRNHHRLGDLYERDDNWEESINHLEKSRDLCQGSEEKNLVPVLLSLSRVYFKAKRYDDALLSNKELVSHQSDSTSLADVFHSMGQAYMKLSQYDESREYLNKSLSIHRALRDSKETCIARILVDLAEINELVDDFEAASDCLVEALRTFELKRDHKCTIDTLENLARINERNNKFEAAKECYEDCVNLKKEFLGEQDLSVARTLHELGCLLIRMNQRKGALEIFESTLRIRKRELGFQNKDTIATIMKIGEIYLRNQDNETALKCFDQALPLTLEICGPDHIDAATCNQTIGAIHCEEGRFQKSVMFLEEAFRIQDNMETTDATQVSYTCHHLGHALCMVGHHAQAIDYLTKAVEIRKDTFGIHSTYYAESLVWLGESYYHCERFDEALVCSTQSLSILKTSSDNYDLLMAQTKLCVANILFLKEEYKNALSMLDSSLQLYGGVGCNNDEIVATIFLLKGKIFAKEEGDLNRAIDEFKKCLAVRKKQNEDTETEAVAEVLMEVGDVLLDQSEYSSALNCYLEGLRIRKISQEDVLLVASATYKVGKVYLKQKKFKEAKSLFDEAHELYSQSEEPPLELGYLAFSTGLVHEKDKKPEQALKSFMYALEILNKDIRSDDDCIASCQFHVGVLLSNKEDYPDATKFLLNALELRRGNLGSNEEDIANILKELARIHGATYQINQAVPLYMEASDIYKKKEKYSDLASCLLGIGSLYLKSDKLDESLRFYEKAHNLHKQKALDDEIDTATILHDLGFIYNQKSRHQESMEVLKQSLKIRLKILGKKSIDVATTCEQLGTALVSLARFEDALKVCTTSLEIYQNELGDNHICCARVMLDIGTIYCHKQNYDLSLVQLEACLHFFKNECGDTTEEVANVLLRIGQIHDLRVDHDEAMKCMTQALEIRTKIYGNCDIRVAETIVNIAHALEDWGDIDEAMECFHNALHIYQECDEELLVAEIHVEIGGICNERKEHKSALTSYQKALSIFKEIVGKNSNEVGNTLRNIGAVYDAKNDIDASYKYYSESLKILRHVLGKEDLGVSLVLNNLGINLARRKKYSKAFEFCKEALRIRRMKLPAEHLDIADTLFNIANILDDAGDQDEQAMRFYSEALTTYRSNFGDENEDVANCFKSIGYIHMRRGESSDAIYKMSEALRIFRMKQGDNNIDVSSLLYSLGRTYGKQAEYDKALSSFNECLRIRTELLGVDHKDVVSTKKFVDAIQRKIRIGR